METSFSQQEETPRLAYFAASAESDAPGRRPTAVTVVAVIGIVAASLLVLGQQFNLSNFALRATAIRTGRVSSDALLGAAIVTALRNFFTVLMLVGCCGALAMRQVGRRAAVVAGFAWLLFGTLELWILYQNGHSLRAGPMRASAGSASMPPAILLTTVFVVLVGIACPLAVVFVLTPRKVFALYARQPARRPLMPRLFKPVAIVVIAVASVWALDGVLGLMQLSSSSPSERSAMPGGYVAPRLLQLPGLWPFYEMAVRNNRDLAVVDGLIWTCLNLAWVAGAALVLNRRREGVWVVIGCCLVRLAFAVGTTNPLEASMMFAPRPGFSSGGTVASTLLPDFNLFLWLLAGRLQGLLAPAVLLVVFTHRAEGGAAGAGVTQSKRGNNAGGSRSRPGVAPGGEQAVA